MRRMKRAGIPGKAGPAEAYRAGRRAARSLMVSSAGSVRPPDIHRLNDAWCGFWGNRRAAARRTHRGYLAAMHAFLRGFAAFAKTEKPGFVLLPTRKTVGAVVTAMNEAATLKNLLAQLARLPLSETVVIINGSRDESFSVAREAGATVVHYPDPLGHDVGRALGAKMTEADIVLFLDGDIPIRAEQLLPFIEAVHRGTDVALNNLTPYLGPLRHWDDVTLMKAFLNHCLDRADLAANSLTAVPHALSRRAIREIGPRELMVPPRAMVRAVLRGLLVSAPGSVDVIAGNKRRRMNTGEANPVSDLIIGDHLEAIHALMQTRGPRIGFADAIRNRRAAEAPETEIVPETEKTPEAAVPADPANGSAAPAAAKPPVSADPAKAARPAALQTPAAGGETA